MPFDIPDADRVQLDPRHFGRLPDFHRVIQRRGGGLDMHQNIEMRKFFGDAQFDIVGNRMARGQADEGINGDRGIDKRNRPALPGPHPRHVAHPRHALDQRLHRILHALGRAVDQHVGGAAPAAAP